MVQVEEKAIQSNVINSSDSDAVLRAEPQTDSAEAELSASASASPREPVFSPRELDTLEEQEQVEEEDDDMALLSPRSREIALLATPAKNRPKPRRTHAVTRSVSLRFKEASSEPTIVQDAPQAAAVPTSPVAAKVAGQGGVRLMMPVPAGFKLKSTGQSPPGSPQ